MSSLALSPVHIVDDAYEPSSSSWDDRRSSIRRTLSELAWLNQIRLKYGPTVSLLDLSAGGAQIETTNYRLRPGSTTVVEVAAGSATLSVPSRVLRAHVSSILPSATTYRAAIAFKRRLDLPQLSADAASTGDDLDISREHARLTTALRRLDKSTLLHTETATGVGRGALAATLALMESPAGRRASVTFSREMSRLFRIIATGLSNDTSPRVILDQMLQGVRRAVPQQVVRVVNQGSLVSLPSDAICFDGLAPDPGCAARLVVEFPRGCRLEAWHLSFLKAAAHLATVINEIERVLAARDRAAASDSARELPIGWKRVVAHFLDGRLLKGFNTNFAAAKGKVDVWMVPNGPDTSRITIPLADLKALFFVQDFEAYIERRLRAEACSEHGRRISVTFIDGEVLEGTTLNYSRKGPGFFVTPLESTGHNVRIFVASGALRHVSFPDHDTGPALVQLRT